MLYKHSSRAIDKCACLPGYKLHDGHAWPYELKLEKEKRHRCLVKFAPATLPATYNITS
jgi:hypothetical protein